MTLQELQQVKLDRENGVIVSPQTWMRVLDDAICKTIMLNGINDRLAFDAELAASSSK